jgi:putative oxidoreductase
MKFRVAQLVVGAANKMIRAHGMFSRPVNPWSGIFADTMGAVLYCSRVLPFRENRMHWMEKLRPLALLFLRVGLGAIFIFYGYPKFFGRTKEHLDEMVNINHLPAYFVYIAGALELGGGSLLVVGLFTRMIGFLLAGEMAIAMWKGEHFFLQPLAVDQYGLALALSVGSFALATFGAGPISLDRAIFGKGK